MNRSFYAVPAVLCLTAAIVTAQAPAGEKPAGDQPSGPGARDPEAQHAASHAQHAASFVPERRWQGDLHRLREAGRRQRDRGFSRTPKPPRSLEPRPLARSEHQVRRRRHSISTPAATVNLTPHANHKVEIVGMVAPAKPGGAARTWRGPSRQIQCGILEDGLGDLPVRSTATDRARLRPCPVIPRPPTHRAAPALRAATRAARPSRALLPADGTHRPRSSPAGAASRGARAARRWRRCAADRARCRPAGWRDPGRSCASLRIRHARQRRHRRSRSRRLASAASTIAPRAFEISTSSELSGSSRRILMRRPTVSP